MSAASPVGEVRRRTGRSARRGTRDRPGRERRAPPASAPGSSAQQPPATSGRAPSASSVGDARRGSPRSRSRTSSLARMPGRRVAHLAADPRRRGRLRRGRRAVGDPERRGAPPATRSVPPSRPTESIGTPRSVNAGHPRARSPFGSWNGAIEQRAPTRRVRTRTSARSGDVAVDPREPDGRAERGAVRAARDVPDARVAHHHGLAVPEHRVGVVEQHADEAPRRAAPRGAPPALRRPRKPAVPARTANPSPLANGSSSAPTSWPHERNPRSSRSASNANAPAWRSPTRRAGGDDPVVERRSRTPSARTAPSRARR